jgi:F-type H+-transporting ATPase subunit b
MWINIVAFLVLFFVLAKFAFPPITKMLDERANKIRESLERAEDTRVEAERLLDEYKVQMAEARQEASKVIEQGRTVAESIKAEILA